jgi:hypothetical protein
VRSMYASESRDLQWLAGWSPGLDRRHRHKERARTGEKWQEMTRHGKKWQEMARHGKSWQDIARRQVSAILWSIDIRE